ncbi:MAG: mercury resistance system transport protein MerF [Rhodospirillaceae bacterium]|nr:mercury resistance system transport protein MerF [Rhodospirillaceae bacterium]
MRNGLRQVSIAGSAPAALCCFTPVLVWLLAGLGLSARAGYLDPVLLPALAVFPAITGYATWRHRRHR